MTTTQTRLQSNTNAHVSLTRVEPIAKRMAQRLPVDFDSWKIGTPVPNKAGGKSAAILDQDGSPILLFTAPLRVPFDAQGFQDTEATRVNLCLDASPELISWAEKVDQQILAKLEVRAQEIFGKKLSPDELRANYHSAVKEADKYGSQLLKLKMNKSGRGTVRIWNEAGIMRPMPASWQDCTVQARAVLKGLWVQGRSFGLTWEVQDALVASESAPSECPFPVS